MECCSLWGGKESVTTERLNSNNTLQRNIGVLGKDRHPSSQGSGWSQGGLLVWHREGLAGEEVVWGLWRSEVRQGS